MIGTTFLLTYGANLARFGVITPIAMHGAFNTTSRFLNGLFAGTAGPRIHIPFELVLAFVDLPPPGFLFLLREANLDTVA